jgi:hypothetical protein
VWGTAGAHLPENVGKGPIEVILGELKGKPAKKEGFCRSRCSHLEGLEAPAEASRHAVLMRTRLGPWAYLMSAIFAPASHVYFISLNLFTQVGANKSPLSNSKSAVRFSSARTTNRFPSSRCASAIQIVRPRQSTVETQPQFQPALLRLSAMIF